MQTKSSNENIQIRLAKDQDFTSIFSIWLEGLKSSFDYVEINNENLRKKFEDNFVARQGIFNYWVATDNDDNIVGWQSLLKVLTHPFKEDTFAESSTYISKNNHYKGVGKLLLSNAINEASASELEYIIGFVAINNEAAKKICRETGWQEIGILPLGRKYNLNKQKIIFIRTL